MAPTKMQEWLEAKNETCKPAEIIRQAKGKAEKALCELISDEISRVCDAFTHDTGLNVNSVSVDFISANTLDGQKRNVIAQIYLSHENA